MRLPLIAPNDLSPEQRPLYEDMRSGIAENFQGFKTVAEDGSLMGPWNLGSTLPNSASRSGN